MLNIIFFIFYHLFYRIVARYDSETMDNSTPPVYALWEGDIVEENTVQREVIQLALNSSSTGSGVYRLASKSIEGAPYRKVTWENQTLTNDQANNFKICPIDASC